MSATLWTIGLAALWVAITGIQSLANLAIGALLGYLVLAFSEHAPGVLTVARKLWGAAALAAFFFRELVAANLKVAHDVVTPAYRMRPAVFAIEIEARTDLEVTLLANLISLTPGTLALDVSDDRRLLYVHAMYGHDRGQIERSITDGLERRLLRVLR